VQCCASVEASTDVVEPANYTVVLNCTLARNGSVMWFHGDKEVDEKKVDDDTQALHLEASELIAFIY